MPCKDLDNHLMPDRLDMFRLSDDLRFFLWMKPSILRNKTKVLILNLKGEETPFSKGFRVFWFCSINANS